MDSSETHSSGNMVVALFWDLVTRCIARLAPTLLGRGRTAVVVAKHWLVLFTYLNVVPTGRCP